jgi:hypothetical protein
VADLATDAAPIQVLENLAGMGTQASSQNAGALSGLAAALRVDGRGLAAADFDNDGNGDIAINTIAGPLVLLEDRNRAGNWLAVAFRGFHPGATMLSLLGGPAPVLRVERGGVGALPRRPLPGWADRAHLPWPPLPLSASRLLDFRVSSMYVDGMHSEATQLAGDTASGDPAVGLAAVSALRALLESLEQLQVGRAREQGWSWQQIAEALGVSKQAVHQKYGRGRRLSRRR